MADLLSYSKKKGKEDSKPNVIKKKGLPSTAGKFARNVINAVGVAFSISSNTLVGPPLATETGLDKVIGLAGSPEAVAVGRIPVTTKQGASSVK